MTDHPIVPVAAVHAAPVFLDARATTDKAVSLIGEAAAHGARYVVFPESYIPAFPVWAALWAPLHNHDLFRAMAEQSIRIDGEEMRRIADAARKHQVYVMMGFSESSPLSAGCLWNAYALFGDDGRLLNHHRKLVPTFFEKLIWAPGDGEGLRVVPTGIGRLGGLICGENTNPLARFALIAQGEQIHVSSWPPIWPTHVPDSGSNYDNLNANRIRAAAHSFEGKLFGIVCAGYMDQAMRDFLVARDPSVADVLDGSPRAASLFIDPTGAQIGDLLRDEEGIAYATFDLSACIEPKQFHDIVGYYNRFDVFDLKVHRQRTVPVTWSGAPASSALQDATACDSQEGSLSE